MLEALPLPSEKLGGLGAYQKRKVGLECDLTLLPLPPRGDSSFNFQKNSLFLPSPAACVKAEWEGPGWRGHKVACWDMLPLWLTLTWFLPHSHCRADPTCYKDEPKDRFP